MHEMPETRRALLGGRDTAWVVDDVSVPPLGPHDILVEVKAASLNRVDLDMLTGAYNGNDSTQDYVAGREAAGLVHSVGSEVQHLRPGCAVMGATPQGGFSTLAVMDSRHTVTVPQEISWEEAGSLPIALSTEHDALVTQAGFTEGDTVLFLGGSSAIGIIGIQMAKALGAAHVIATTTHNDKIQTLLNVGADTVVNTTDDNWPQQVLDATHGTGVDIVLDHLAGQPLADALPCTRIGGTIINIGRLAGRSSTISLDALSFRRLRLQGTTFSVRTAEERGAVYTALLDHVIPGVRDGSIRPLIDSVRPHTEANLAADLLRTGSPLGKIVLTF